MTTSPYSPSERSNPRRPLVAPLARAVAVLFALLLVSPLFAQEAGGRRVANPTGELFVYVTLDEEGWLSQGQELWRRDPAAFMEERVSSLDFIPSGGERTIAPGLSMAGYLVDPQQSVWGLATVSSGASLVEREGQGRSVAASRLPSPPDSILLDGRFADWEREPLISRFSPGGEPGSFIREERGRREQLPLSESTLWSTPGSLLEEIKIRPGVQALYVYLSYPQPPAPETDLYLYLYGDSPEAAIATILLNPAPESSGATLYLPEGRAIRVGNLLRRGSSLEGELRIPGEGELLDELRFAVISTVVEGDSWYEEFPVTRVELSDLLD